MKIIKTKIKDLVIIQTIYLKTKEVILKNYYEKI